MLGRLFEWGGSYAPPASSEPSSQPAIVLHLVPGAAAGQLLLLLALTADALDCWQVCDCFSVPNRCPVRMHSKTCMCLCR
jgi:hypothetical protein